MRLVIAALLVVLPAAPALADPAPKEASDAKEKFSLIHVDELAKLMASNSKVQVFDANGDDFRAANGVIPGATMLASFKIDPAKTLPADKSTPIVFYCANSH